MSYSHRLANFAFGYLIFDQQGHLQEDFNGALFHLPSEVKSPKNIAFYSQLCREGWHRCPLGYGVRLFSWQEDSRLIIPGLKVNGISTIQGRNADYSIKADPKFFDDYFNLLRDPQDGSQPSNKIDFTSELVHDVRRMNALIYQNAYQLYGRLDNSYDRLSRDLAGNIRALSEVLSGRIDIAELEDGQILDSGKIDTIAVYRKVDKIVRSFKSYGRESGINIQLNGLSNSEVRGPAIFDTMIYAVLDNMVKYGVSSSDVDVNVTEDTNSFLITFTGVSPIIKGDEVNSIFQKGFRGTAASASGIGGSGMGLFVSKKICEEYFAGEICLQHQGSSVLLNGRLCSNKEFLIRVPFLNSFS